MQALARLRARRSRRRAARAERAVEQAELRREIEADDKSLVEAAHPPIPPGGWAGGSGF
jgi:hypothetical protein